MNAIKNCLVLIAIFFSSSQISAHASQSQRAPICEIQGQVINENDRIVELQGMSSGIKYNYHDVDVTISASSFNDAGDEQIFENEDLPFNCNIKLGSIQTYQSRTGSHEVGFVSNLINSMQTKYKGKCVKAKTNASGDGNFTYGNWIYDIEIIEQSKCGAGTKEPKDD